MALNKKGILGIRILGIVLMEMTLIPKAIECFD
jgi:hypothetical protein